MLGDPKDGCCDEPPPPDTDTVGERLIEGIIDPEPEGAIPCNEGADEGAPFITPCTDGDMLDPEGPDTLDGANVEPKARGIIDEGVGEVNNDGDAGVC